MSTPQDKIKLIAEGSQLVSVTNPLKLTSADGKNLAAQQQNNETKGSRDE